MSHEPGRFKPFATARVFVGNNKTGRGFRSPKPMKIFVDSGASITIIPEEALPTLKSHVGEFETAPARVQTANGEKDVTVLKDVSLCLNTVCYRGNVLTSGGIQGDLLLGTDFLATSKCKVDFRKKVITCDGKKLPFTLER